MSKQVKVKTFFGFKDQNERSINDWLEKNKDMIEFVFATSTSYTQEVTTTIFYTGDSLEELSSRIKNKRDSRGNEKD